MVNTITREYEIVLSDRIELINQANVFITSIINKQICNFGTEFEKPELVELSPKELETYNEALDFIKRQFQAGFKENEVLERMIVKENEED